MNLNSKYKFNMKGWFKDSWRHALAAKGVKTKRHYFEPKVSLEKELGAENVYEIKPVHHKPGRKALLMQELDYWQSMKVLAEKDEMLDKKEIDDKIDILQNKIKRITGRPPTGVVRGETKSELIEGVIDRYEKTSTKRPDFVKELEIIAAVQKKPSHKEELEKGIAVSRYADQVKRSREIQAYKRAVPRVVSFSEDQAFEDEEKPLTIDVVRFKKGRKPKSFAKKPEAYLSSWKGDKYVHGPRVLEPKKFKAIYVEPKSWVRKRSNYIANIREIRHMPKTPGTKVKVGTLKEGVSIKYGSKGRKSLKGELALQSFEKPR